MIFFSFFAARHTGQVAPAPILDETSKEKSAVTEHAVLPEDSGDWKTARVLV